MSDYEITDVYKALQQIANRQGYDTFAVIFINQQEQKVVRPVKLHPVEQEQLNEVVKSL